MPRAFRSPLHFSTALADTLWTVGHLSLSRDPQQAFSPWCRRLLRHLRVDIHLEGGLPPGGQLWVANHLSWLDPLVLLSLRPSGVLAKREVAEYPLIGRGAQRVGVRFVRRENPSSRATALKGLRGELAKGHGFLLFPEGTTTQGKGLAPLHKGGLRLAFRMKVPVLTLNLSSDDTSYPWVGERTLLSHIGGLCRSDRTVVRVCPRSVIHPRDFASESDWIARIREDIHPIEVRA